MNTIVPLDEIVCDGFPRTLLIYLYTIELHLSGQWLTGSPIIRIGSAHSGKFVENSTKITCSGSGTVQWCGF